jgi:xanthine/uracil/vitamin C permease (AzgA family)
MGNIMILGWIIGSAMLLIMCVCAFDGLLAAAIWQVSSIGWVYLWYRHVEKCK